MEQDRYALRAVLEGSFRRDAAHSQEQAFHFPFFFAPGAWLFLSAEALRDEQEQAASCLAAERHGRGPAGKAHTTWLR